MTSTVNLPDDDPFHVSLLLHFLYRQRYTRAVEDINDPTNKPRVHIHMYELGDKYDIPELSLYAAGCLEDIVSFRWGQDLVHLLNAVHLVYERNPDITRKLRDIVLVAVVRRSTEIAADSEQRNRLVELVHEIEQFREELCLAQLYKPTPEPYMESWNWDQ